MSSYGRAMLWAAIASLVAPTLAAAQGTTTSSTPQQLPVVTEKVEVVATKLPEAPHEVPAAIEVISGEELRNMGATSLKDALAMAAGVSIAPGGDAGPAGSVPEFWGLREFDAFLLVVDGVPWGGAFNPALTSLSMRDVERIEVLRGAAPVTFGATSFVGVIHVVHKAGSADRSYANASLGNYGSGSGGVDFAIPTAGNWKSRLSAGVEHQGFRDDRTSFTRTNASWRAINTNGANRTWFSADLSFLRQSPASATPREGKVLSPNVPLDANHNPSGAFMDQNRFALSFGMDRKVWQDTALSVTASFAHTGSSAFRGFLTDVAEASDNATGLRQNIDVNDLYADVHLAWPERHKVRFIVGSDFLHGMGDSSGQTFVYTVPLSGVPATSVTEPTDLPLGSEDRREFFGAYGLAEWRPTPKFTASAGLRLNVTFEEKGEKPEPPGAVDKGQTNVKPSGSVGAIYTLWEDGVNHVRIYGDFRSTFKPAVFDFGLGEAVESGLLKPETAHSVEGGVKVTALDARMDFEASGFRMDFNNLVTSTVVDGLPALMNAGKTRFQGLELATDARLPRAVTARVTYSFHDSKFVDFVQAFDGVPTQLAGKRFEMSPRHLFTFGGILAPENGVVANLIVKYTGDRYMDKRNRALAEAFTTVDLGLGYRWGQYEVRFDGRNLSDRRDPVAESELGDAQYYRMFPREYRLSFGVRF